MKYLFQCNFLAIYTFLYFFDQQRLLRQFIGFNKMIKQKNELYENAYVICFISLKDINSQYILKCACYFFLKHLLISFYILTQLQSHVTLLSEVHRSLILIGTITLQIIWHTFSPFVSHTNTIYLFSCEQKYQMSFLLISKLLKQPF